MNTIEYIHKIPGNGRGHADPRKGNGWHPANCHCEPTVQHRQTLDGYFYIEVNHQDFRTKRQRSQRPGE